MPNENFAYKLEEIQQQLASLETSYANFTRTYYNMFYNSTPMDITLEIYDKDGSLKEVTVPNRAKDRASVSTGLGTPYGIKEGKYGDLYLDTDSGNLWYCASDNGTEGWSLLSSSTNWVEGIDYLAPNGEGTLLTALDANNITGGVLSMKYGGTGTTVCSGMLKGIPPTVSNGVEIPGYITTAIEGIDYLSSANFAGMIVYFPTEQVPAGYLVCDGAGYPIAEYRDLYNVLVQYNFPDINEYVEHEVRKFHVPNLSGLYIRSARVNHMPPDRGTIYDYETENDRKVCSIQRDCIPNIYGTWVQEVTGAEKGFTGAIKIAIDEKGNPKQVDGKTSAPAGSYDYEIEFNARNLGKDDNEKAVYQRVFQDGAPEVRVCNIALVPAIKI